MNNAQMQAMKQNAGNLAEQLSNNASAIADNLVDEAQSTAAKVGTQLADWTENHGHKVAGLMSLSGMRVRNLVLTRPLFCLTLVAGASALAAYLLTRRYAQTDRQAGAHDKTGLHAASQAGV